MGAPSALSRFILLSAIAACEPDVELVVTSSADCPEPGAAIAVSVNGKQQTPICIGPSGLVTMADDDCPAGVISLQHGNDPASRVCVGSAAPVRLYDCSTNPDVDAIDAIFVALELGDLVIVSAQVTLPRAAGGRESVAGTQVLRGLDRVTILLFLENGSRLEIRVEKNQINEDQIQVVELLPGGSRVDRGLVGVCTSSEPL